MSENENNDNGEMKFNFWTIDRSMGESRFAQVLGVLLFIGIVIFSILFKMGYFGI
ncbi:unnamed protein product [marine sediment metagenome]|uniref:Uncharacterized protein n=1 Tax=marine sediment metagenome TaxID=412755 RepID=X1CEN5_9ZZZZ